MRSLSRMGALVNVQCARLHKGLIARATPVVLAAAVDALVAFEVGLAIEALLTYAPRVSHISSRELRHNFRKMWAHGASFGGIEKGPHR